MKIKDIFEDTGSDTYYRNLANKIANSLISEISTNGFADAKTQETLKGDVYIYSLSFFSNEDFNSKILIHDYHNKDVDAGLDSNGNIHIFYDFDNSLPIRDNYELKKTIVHELIHLFDNKRSGNRIKPSATDFEKGGIGAYINSDSELNTFYHEMLYDVEDKLESFKMSDSYHKVFNLLLSTPERFINFALGQLPSQVKDNLSNENLKKYKSRLYRYYDEYSSGWFIEDNDIKLEDINNEEQLDMDISDLDIINEAIYDGMIGLMEIVKFMKIASIKQKELFKKYAEQKETRKAWELVSDVIEIEIPLDKVINDSKKE